MEGLLLKRCGTVFKTTEKRWFKRDRHDLKWFLTKDESTPRGNLNLYDLSLIELVEGEEDVPRTKFNLMFGPKKSLFLEAETEVLKDRWVESLLNWVKCNSPNDPIKAPIRYIQGILASIDYCLSHNGGCTEGLFRISGSQEAVDDIYRQMYISGDAFYSDNMIPEAYTIYDVSSSLKKMIRELPETVLTNALIAQIKVASDKLVLKDLVRELPPENAAILSKLFKLSRQLCVNTKETSMSIGALAICIGPNFEKHSSSFALFNFSDMFTMFIKEQEFIFDGIEDSIEGLFCTPEKLDLISKNQQLLMETVTTVVRPSKSRKSSEPLTPRRSSIFKSVSESLSNAKPRSKGLLARTSGSLSNFSTQEIPEEQEVCANSYESELKAEMEVLVSKIDHQANEIRQLQNFKTSKLLEIMSISLEHFDKTNTLLDEHNASKSLQILIKENQQEFFTFLKKSLSSTMPTVVDATQRERILSNDGVEPKNPVSL